MSIVSFISRAFVLAVIFARATLSSRIQEGTNSQILVGHGRETVPGDNTAAYYCKAASREEQLFFVEEYTIAPNPPVPEHRFFGFLMGIMPNEPDLNNASLRFTKIFEGREERHVDFNLSTEFIFKRHNRFEYGPEIKPGRMEFLMDSFWLGQRSARGIYTMRAESKLPDGRFLFCLEFSYYHRGPCTLVSNGRKSGTIYDSWYANWWARALGLNPKSNERAGSEC
ncbi:MAG: hypothetical protein M1820_001972 [Bogoriella megaspora]|nr:MAG: hypothetical protein M1820_001972 [Bogoriella megaspora]